MRCTALALVCLPALLSAGVSQSWWHPHPGNGPYTLRVHVLRAKSYKPVRGKVVYAGTSGIPGPFLNWEAKTGKNGVAVFHPNGVAALHMAHPPRALGIQVDDPVDSWGCSQVIFCTEDLLARGFVATDECWGALHGKHPKPPPKIDAGPGDVYIFVHMVSRWSWAWNETIGSHYFGPRVNPPRPDPASCPPVTAQPAAAGSPSSR